MNLAKINLPIAEYFKKDISFHTFLLAIAGSILIFGSLITTLVDINLYRCYANVFLVKNFAFCLSKNIPHSILPAEYPILALIPMVVALIGGNALYTITFSLLMFSVIMGIYFFLYYRSSKGAAVSFLIYCIVGAFGLAVSRLDIIVGLLIVISLHLANKKRFYGAYTILAIATMFKIIPLLLVLPVFLAEQSQTREKTIARFHGLCLYAIICLGIFAISLSIDAPGTLSPLTFNFHRPIQVESTLASVLVGFSYLQRIHYCFAPGYGSLNIYGFQAGQCNPTNLTVYNSLNQIVLFSGMLLFFLGLFYVILLFIFKKISLSQAYLAILLVFLSTGKVFSPQYLLWLYPLIAYIYGFDRRWFVITITIGVLTTVIYPFLYGQTIFTSPYAQVHLLANVIFARNVLFVLLTVFYLSNFLHIAKSKQKEVVIL